MSAVPNPKSAAAKAVDSNADNINPAEAARRAKLAEQAKYTDVKRTSSASFKPPMSKDQIVKPPIQPPPKDSSWFHPFSYIKTMFGSKSVANATATGANPNIMDKSNKSEQLNNVTSKNANAGKYNKYIRDPEPETRSNALGTEGREGNPSARLTHSNDVVTPRPKSPSFSVSPKDAITRRDVKRPYGSGLFDHDDDENSNIPKYKPIQSVDNQSTYLHAPDKKGTTSFRITTVPKVGLKQVPTLLSPSFSSQTQHKRPVKMNRKGSTSPHKKGSDIGSARLRSKSTPDSSTLKPRPRIARGYMFGPLDRSPPPRDEDVKHVSSWHSQQEYKKRRILQREKEKIEEELRKRDRQRRDDSSPLSFFKKFMSPSYNKEDSKKKGNNTQKRDNNTQRMDSSAQRRDTPFNYRNSEKVKEKTQPKTEVTDSPTKFMESAMEALSTKFSEFTTTESPKPPQKEDIRKQRPTSPARGRRFYSENPKPDTKSEKNEESSSPLQSTITMISTFVQETLQQGDEPKKSETSPKLIRPGRLMKRPDTIGSSKYQKAEAETINSSPSESFHRRPSTPSEYHITPRKHPNTVSSNSWTRLNPFDSSSSPRKSTQRDTDPNQEGEPEDLTLASAFQKLSSLVQSKLSPLVDKKDTDKGPDQTRNQDASHSPMSTNQENNHFYYLKKNRHSADGSTRLAREDSSDGKKMESTFLKSRRERSRSPSPLQNVAPPKPGATKPNSLSTYKRSPSPVHKKDHQKKKLSPFRGGSPPNRRNQTASPMKRDSSPNHMGSTMSRLNN